MQLKDYGHIINILVALVLFMKTSKQRFSMRQLSISFIILICYNKLYNILAYLAVVVKRKSNNNKRLYNTSANEFSCFLFDGILHWYLLILYHEHPEFAITFPRVQVRKSTTIVLQLQQLWKIAVGHNSSSSNHMASASSRKTYR